MKRFILVLPAVLLACDEKPKTRYEMAQEANEKAEQEKSAQLKKYAGREFHTYKGEYSTYGPWLHLRKDCPEYKPTKSDRVFNVKVNAGRIVDEKGFYYDSAYFCDRCVP